MKRIYMYRNSWQKMYLGNMIYINEYFIIILNICHFYSGMNRICVMCSSPIYLLIHNLLSILYTFSTNCSNFYWFQLIFLFTFGFVSLMFFCLHFYVYTSFYLLTFAYSYSYSYFSTFSFYLFNFCLYIFCFVCTAFYSLIFVHIFFCSFICSLHLFVNPPIQNFV